MFARTALALSLLASACGRPVISQPVPDISAIADMSSPGDQAIRCTQASCQAPTPACDPVSGQCFPCLADDHCPEGKVCRARSCEPGCSMSHGCGDAGMCDPKGMCKICTLDGDCAAVMGSPRCDLASGRCVACLPMNHNCPKGAFCTLVNGQYQCTMGCKTVFDCTPPAVDGGAPPRMDCCQNLCVDLNNDGANCGQCGKLCNGQTCCSGACADLATDLANCKACGMKCAIPNAMVMCMKGCVFQSCNMGFADCDQSLGNGCESNLPVDLNNCGMCGKKCPGVPNGFPGCFNSTCIVGGCFQGFDDCDKMVGNGCEVKLDADPDNCAMCGKKCAVPANASASCANGVCGFTCQMGFGNCDNNAGNGCEADTSSDKSNCGVCGKVCVAANGTAACVNGACTLAGCNAGFEDCNMNPADGCEVNTTNDKNNCSACGMVCPNNNLCINSMCSLTCAPSGARAPFNVLAQDTATGCWNGNPCVQNAYNFAAANGQNFAGFGQSITCSGGATCVSHVGLTTYTGSTTLCQGAWDVFCDNVKVGTLNTLGKTCGVSAMGNACNIVFSPVTCTQIRLTAVNDGDNSGACCGNGQPDSMMVGVSAW